MPGPIQSPIRPLPDPSLRSFTTRQGLRRVVDVELRGRKCAVHDDAHLWSTRRAGGPHRTRTDRVYRGVACPTDSREWTRTGPHGCVAAAAARARSSGGGKCSRSVKRPACSERRARQIRAPTCRHLGRRVLATITSIVPAPNAAPSISARFHESYFRVRSAERPSCNPPHPDLCSGRRPP